MGESYRKMSVLDTTGTITGLSFNARYEKMDREEKPKVIHKDGDVEVFNRETYDDTVLLPGMVKKLWVDANGGVHDKDKIKHYFDEQEVAEKSQTKSFEISGFQPLSAYTDMYVIEKYYELFPDDNGSKKDFEREVSARGNAMGMRRLWEHLHNSGVVARGEFNTSSRGFLSSDGYIRAISFGNKWGLEIGVFKEEKVFRHLHEGIPEALATGVAKQGPVKLKLVR